MSCYFRDMNDVFKEASITVTPGNKRQIDQAFHQIAGVTYKDCSNTWKKLKQELMGDEEKRRGLIQMLQATTH